MAGAWPGHLRLASQDRRVRPGDDDDGRQFAAATAPRRPPICCLSMTNSRARGN